MSADRRKDMSKEPPDIFSEGGIRSRLLALPLELREEILEFVLLTTTAEAAQPIVLKSSQGVPCLDFSITRIQIVEKPLPVAFHIDRKTRRDMIAHYLARTAISVPVEHLESFVRDGIVEFWVREIPRSVRVTIGISLEPLAATLPIPAEVRSELMLDHEDFCEEISALVARARLWRACSEDHGLQRAIWRLRRFNVRMLINFAGRQGRETWRQN